MRLLGRDRTYLDWAAAAPAAESAARAYARAAQSFGNPSSPHAEGRAAKRILEDARAGIARELSVKPDDIIFTSGATEANNLAIQAVGAAARMRGVKAPHLLYLPSAHASVIETMRAMEHSGFSIEPLSVKDGAVDIEAFQRSLRPETALVSMDFVDSETGTIWNTREVKHVLEHYAATLSPQGAPAARPILPFGASAAAPLLHVDASQAPLEESVERTRLGGDLIVLDSAKAGGMRGIGILAAPRSVPLMPLIHGGGQERGLRSGTESPALAAAFAAALAEAREGREAFAARAAKRRGEAIAAISDISNIFVNQGKKGVAHILNISLASRDTDYLVALLDEAGFAVSTKSACESDSAEGSRAVRTLTNDPDRAASTLRVSWGPSTNKRDLVRFAAALRRAVAFLDENPS